MLIWFVIVQNNFSLLQIRKLTATFNMVFFILKNRVPYEEVLQKNITSTYNYHFDKVIDDLGFYNNLALGFGLLFSILLIIIIIILVILLKKWTHNNEDSQESTWKLLWDILKCHKEENKKTRSCLVLSLPFEEA